MNVVDVKLKNGALFSSPAVVCSCWHGLFLLQSPGSRLKPEPGWRRSPWSGPVHRPPPRGNLSGCEGGRQLLLCPSGKARTHVEESNTEQQQPDMKKEKKLEIQTKQLHS